MKIISVVLDTDFADGNAGGAQYTTVICMIINTHHDMNICGIFYRSQTRRTDKQI